MNITNHSFSTSRAKRRHATCWTIGSSCPLSSYTPVDATLIPTGERRSVAGTPFDFRQPRTIGQRIRDGRDEQLRIGRGYDHNFVIASEPSPARAAIGSAARRSGVRPCHGVLTTAPGVQFYSGQFSGRHGRRQGRSHLSSGRWAVPRAAAVPRLAESSRFSQRAARSRARLREHDGLPLFGVSAHDSTPMTDRTASPHAPPALARLVRRSRQRRHDRALSRALHELRLVARGAAVGQADHRHRADRQRPVAVQPPSSGARGARARRRARGRRHRAGVSGASDPGDRQAADRGLWIAISPTSAWSKCCSAIRSMASC